MIRLIRNYVLLIGVAAIAIGPLLWALSTALKVKTDVEIYPPHWIPHPPTLVNFQTVLMETSVLDQFLNSTFVGIAAVVLSVLIAAHAAYALARFTFPGKNGLAFTILMTSMVPEICILVPLYYLASWTGVYDTYGFLILVYAATQVPTMMWFLKGFFEALPRELDEAAQIDGCTPWTAFYRVILPLAKPGLAAAGLLAFIFVWNDFLIAFTLTISNSRRMLAVGLYQYISQYGVDWANLMAAVILALVPVLVLFAVLQKHFVSGLTAGATKG
jgi:multiple sugar transport system permease protein